MQIFLNGEAKIVPKGTTLATLLMKHPTGCGIAILRSKTTAPWETNALYDTSQLRFVTTVGDVVVKLLPNVVLPLSTENVSNENLRVHWEDKYAVAFGPFKANFTPDHQPYRYDRGVLCLGCGGYDSEISYLIFSRLQHIRDHGTAPGGAILGTIISGLGIMNRWRNGDRITRIEHIISSIDKTNVTVTTDLSLMVEDGMQIFSEISVDAEGYKEDHNEIDISCAKSVEHLLFALHNSKYLIDRIASTYIRDHTEGKLDVPMELQKPRREGTVTVRTSGKSSGAIYIYTKDVPSNQHHTRTGTIVRGIELAKFAEIGTKLSIKIVPEQLDLRGLPLKEAVASAKTRGLRVLADNRDVDGRIVIDQKPATTLEVLKNGIVALSTVAIEDVIDITLDYEHAPRTVDLFRRVTGLKKYAIGSMPFIYNIDDEMYLFKPKFASNINIIPENVPKQSVPPYVLAITNDARKARGMTGVRNVANKEYGPTGEPFDGTNVIGTVLDIDKLPLIKDGSIVFIREMKS
ncbi:MAG: methanogenesis marker 3 protein [Methanocalculaceae archaeon]|jgi:putative methanogenesis marker protein 3|nr:methanogenesis marker 3 protein [Methanocalculaceae archaeon]